MVAPCFFGSYTLELLAGLVGMSRIFLNEFIKNATGNRWIEAGVAIAEEEKDQSGYKMLAHFTDVAPTPKKKGIGR